MRRESRPTHRSSRVLPITSHVVRLAPLVLCLMACFPPPLTCEETPDMPRCMAGDSSGELDATTPNDTDASLGTETFDGVLDAADEQDEAESSTSSDAEPTDAAETSEVDTESDVARIECEALDCDAQHRECLDAGDDDAACGDCVESYDLVGGECVPRLSAPTGVVASTDRAATVEVSWDAAPNAQGYRVYRCDGGCEEDANWSALATIDDGARIFVDADVEPPGVPGPSDDVTATRDRTDRVDVEWSAVSAPLAAHYAYRVTTLGESGESPPSEAADGATAERPVVGYEIRIDGGTWQQVPSGLATTWSDAAAPPATLVAGSASASIGVHAEFVRLIASGASATPGPSRSYSVRALTAYGPAISSAAATGWRASGNLAHQWERSADATASDFAPIAGATSATYDDTTAPADGATRYYRVVVSAVGAEAVTSAPVAGARQGPPEVPGGVRATNDRADRVLVEWQAVSGAIGYHVYRDGERLTSGSGVTTTSYDDYGAPPPSAGWASPTAVVASTDDTSGVTVTWEAPLRPVGAEVTYVIRAVNAAGDGAASAPAAGARAEPEIVGFDIEVAPVGGTATWISTGSTSTTWIHAAAPLGTIESGSVTASQGLHIGYVDLSTTAATVIGGAEILYRVRGVLQGGGGYTPVSASGPGRRATGAVTYRWQRSLDGTPVAFADVEGGTSTAHQDGGAPVDGEKRWYRMRLQADGAATGYSTPVDGWRLAFKAVSVSQSSSCAISADSRLWCWGDGAAPALVTLPAGVDRNVAEIGLSWFHRCVRTANGEVWCWGMNNYGQIGDGTTVTRSVPTRVSTLAGDAISLGVGAYSTCAALVDGRVQCWGFNGSGQLGNNSTVDSPLPVTVIASFPTELDGAIEVSVGSAHACARVGDRLWCWGGNSLGQLGTGTGDSPVAVSVPNLFDVTAVSLGSSHSCVIDGGTPTCWGFNANGQVGGPGTPVMSPRTLPLIGIPSVAAHQYSSCVVSPDSVGVWCWGADTYGQLGNGAPKTNSTSPVAVTGAAGATAVAAGQSAEHTCALIGHAVRCWGKNDKRQLGDGTTTERPSPVSVQFP